MDFKLIGQYWTQFLKQQANYFSSSSTNSESLEKNPFYSKYAEKLKNHSLNNQNQKKSAENNSLIGEKLDEILEKNPTSNNVSNQSKHICYTKNKKLDSIVKLDSFINLEKVKIKEIWHEHFKSKKNSIFAVLDSNKYNLINKNSSLYPTFVFLLPVNDLKNSKTGNRSYNFILVQFSKHQVYFTPLAFYHTHKENAIPVMVLNYFTELKVLKDIVLMEGEYDEKILNAIQAQCLANQVELFYNQFEKEKIKLLDDFNNKSNEFDFNRIINNFESNLVI